MPIELDKGHDQPIFGPEGKPDMAECLRLAREIVEFCDRTTRLSVWVRSGTMAARQGRADTPGGTA